MYAVCFIRDGDWQMHMAFASKSAAKIEADYLSKSLGLTANVFKKATA